MEKNSEILEKVIALGKKKDYRAMYRELSNLDIEALNDTAKTKLCNTIWATLIKNKKIQEDFTLFKDFAKFASQLDLKTSKKFLKEFGKEKIKNKRQQEKDEIITILKVIEDKPRIKLKGKEKKPIQQIIGYARVTAKRGKRGMMCHEEKTAVINSLTRHMEKLGKRSIIDETRELAQDALNLIKKIPTNRYEKDPKDLAIIKKDGIELENKTKALKRKIK